MLPDKGGAGVNGEDAMRAGGFLMSILLSTANADIALAQSAATSIPAPDEYQNSCAVCHGPNGKGDGPMALFLTVKPPDLTALAQKNRGKFPFEKVMRVIDGRSEVGAHGTRTMPIWGDRYMSESSAAYMQEPYRSYTAEPIIRARILELTYYIQSIQQQGHSNQQ
jgi:mono/diheme cytochrome c family protein